MPVADNTCACTLNVSAVGAKNIKISDGAGSLTDPAAGDLDTAIVADVIYDGTQFILQNPATFASALAQVSGHSIYSNGSAWVAEFLAGNAPNVARNPMMRFDDRVGPYTSLGTASVDLLNGYHFLGNGSGTQRWTCSHESSGGVTGKQKWLKMLCTTEDETPAVGEGWMFWQTIEAYTINHGLTGDAGMPTTTLSFDVIAHADGSSGITFPATCAVGLRTRDNDREVTHEFTIAAADTWERIDVEIVADASAQVNHDNGEGLYIQWGLDGGANSEAAAEGVWHAAATDVLIAGGDRWGDQANNYVGVTNVDLHKGPPRPFVAPSYQLDRVQENRYYRKILATTTNTSLFICATDGTTWARYLPNFEVEMRTAPTLTFTVGTMQYIETNSVRTLSSAALAGGNPQGGRVTLTIVGATAGTAGYIDQSSGSPTGSIVFDADF